MRAYQIIDHGCENCGSASADLAIWQGRTYGIEWYCLPCFLWLEEHAAIRQNAVAAPPEWHPEPAGEPSAPLKGRMVRSLCPNGDK